MEVDSSVTYMQLATLKSNLRMNKIGLKHSAQRGHAIRPVWADYLGLKPRDSYDLYIAEVQKRMDKLLEEVREGRG